MTAPFVINVIFCGTIIHIYIQYFMQSNSTRPQIYFYGIALAILFFHIPGFPRFIQTPITLACAGVLIFLTYKVFSAKKLKNTAPNKVVYEKVSKVEEQAPVSSGEVVETSSTDSTQQIS